MGPHEVGLLSPHEIDRLDCVAAFNRAVQLGYVETGEEYKAALAAGRQRFAEHLRDLRGGLRG